MKNLAVICGAFVAAILLTGCATEVGHHTFLKGPLPPKPESHPVQVFTNGLPTQPFDRVAILDAHCESQGFLEPNFEHDALPVLLKEARAAGCDAIIEVQKRKPDNWTLETRTWHFSATGIVFKQGN